MSPLGAALALLLAASPFQAEQPSVRDGNERLRAGDAAGALERYGRGEAEAGTHPEIDFDRGNALHAQGREEAAREAWARAAEAAKTGPLASKALQNTGSALEAAGDQAGAVRAFTEALRRDPGNEDARYNLEALLRRREAEKKQQQERQQPQQGGQKQGGKDPKADPQSAEPRPGEKGPQPPQPQDPKEEPGQDPAGGREGEAPQDGRAGAGARSNAIGTQDAERLLDAMRARERSMPLRAAPRKDGRRRDVDKDW